MSVNIPPKMTSEEAEALLKRQLGSRVVGLRVQIHEAGIALQGTVSSYYDKQLVQHSAMRILGLSIMANEIEVSLKLRSFDCYGLELD